MTVVGINDSLSFSNRPCKYINNQGCSHRGTCTSRGNNLLPSGITNLVAPLLRLMGTVSGVASLLFFASLLTWDQVLKPLRVTLISEGLYHSGKQTGSFRRHLPLKKGPENHGDV